MALVPLNDTVTRPSTDGTLRTHTGAALILDTLGDNAEVWGDEEGTIPATNPVPVVDGRYPLGLWIEENRYIRVIEGDAQTFEAAKAVPGGAASQADLASAALPPGGDVGDVVTNTGPGEGEWQAPSVGSSDLPTADEKAALAGTEGDPSDTNRYVTDEDPRIAGGGAGSTAGTTIGTVALDVGGNPVLTVDSIWGIDGDDQPYYDPAGAAPGEDAVLRLADDGSLNLTTITGQVP